jgi:hypothetical protein
VRIDATLKLLALGAATVSVAAHASAQERFTWQAPAECPSSEAVLDSVAELAGPRPIDLDPFDAIRARVERFESDWQLTLTLVVGTRQRLRRLRAPSCEELVQAAGVALALALDDEQRIASGDDESWAEAPSSSEPESPAVELPRAPAPQAPELPHGEIVKAPEGPLLSFAIAGEALLDGTALPDPALGVGVSLGVRAAGWAMLGFGVLLPAQDTGVGNGGRVEFSLFAAGARGCYALAEGLLRPSACVGVELGRLGATGAGLTPAASYADWWLASAAGAELSGDLVGGWYWAARGEAVVPLLRERYFANDNEWGHRAALPGFRLGLGAGLALE